MINNSVYNILKKLIFFIYLYIIYGAFIAYFFSMGFCNESIVNIYDNLS